MHFATTSEHVEQGKIAWSHSSNDVYRRVELDTPVDVDNVTAEFKHGLLKIVALKGAKPAEIVQATAAA